MKKLLIIALVFFLYVSIAFAVRCGDFEISPFKLSDRIPTTGNEKYNYICRIAPQDTIIELGNRTISFYNIDGILDPNTGLLKGKTIGETKICGKKLKFNVTFTCNIKTNEIKINEGTTKVKNFLIRGSPEILPMEDKEIIKGSNVYLNNIKLNGIAKIKDSGRFIFDGDAFGDGFRISGKNVHFSYCGDFEEKNYIDVCEKLKIGGENLELSLNDNNQWTSGRVSYKIFNGEIELHDNFAKIKKTSSVEHKNGEQTILFDNGEIILKSNAPPKTNIVESYLNNIIKVENNIISVGNCIEYPNFLIEGSSTIMAEGNKICKKMLELNFHPESSRVEKYIPMSLTNEKILNENTKNMEKYANKQVFIISNENYQDIFQAVPIAMWNGNENCQRSRGKCLYPFLIYHKEDKLFDIESILIFLKQYKPSKVVFFGDPGKEIKDLIKELGLEFEIVPLLSENIDRYFEWWNKIQEVVVVDENYKNALVASIYAAKINAPLVFYEPSIEETLKGKKVITVGSINLKNIVPEKTYTLEELENEFTSDKLLLINANDYKKEFCEKISLKIPSSYCGVSMTAPILAFSKDEKLLIVETDPAPTLGNLHELPNAANIIENAVKTKLDKKYDFLTILASPKGIPLKKINSPYPSFSEDEILAKIVGAKSWGRIFGVSVSDVSSYIARAIFFSDDTNTLRRKLTKVYLGGEDDPIAKGYFVNIKRKLERSGINVYCSFHGAEFEEQKFLQQNGCGKIPKSLANPEIKNYDIIFSDGHSTVSGWPNPPLITLDDTEMQELNLTLGIIASCNTLNYYLLETGYWSQDRTQFFEGSPYLFGAWFLRKGGIGYIGAIAPTRGNDGFTLVGGFGEDILNNLFSNPNIGSVLNAVYENDPYGCSLVGSKYHVFIYLGDPTLNLNLRKMTQKHYITYYGGIYSKKCDFHCHTVQKKLGERETNQLIIYVDSPEERGFENYAKLKIKTLDGKPVTEIKGTCSPTIYCSGAKNTKNPVKCIFNFALTGGAYTCDLIYDGEVINCPFWFDVAGELKIVDIVVYHEPGYPFGESSLSYGNITVTATVEDKKGVDRILYGEVEIRNKDGKLVGKKKARESSFLTSKTRSFNAMFNLGPGVYYPVFSVEDVEGNKISMQGKYFEIKPYRIIVKNSPPYVCIPDLAEEKLNVEFYNKTLMYGISLTAETECQNGSNRFQIKKDVNCEKIGNAFKCVHAYKAPQGFKCSTAFDFKTEKGEKERIYIMEETSFLGKKDLKPELEISPSNVLTSILGNVVIKINNPCLFTEESKIYLRIKENKKLVLFEKINTDDFVKITTSTEKPPAYVYGIHFDFEEGKSYEIDVKVCKKGKLDCYRSKKSINM